MGRVAFLLAFSVGLALPITARADGEPASVVVLPFATTDDELVIYGKAVADAVARGLGEGGGELAVERDPRGRADLAVELRASRTRRKVRVEAVVRDAETGATLARVEGKPTPLADLDLAARDLARRLRAPLAAAVGDLRRRQALEQSETVADPAPAAPRAAPIAPTTVDTRPTVVVYQPDGATGAPVPVPLRSLGTRAVVQALSGMGFRAIVSSNAGVVPAEIAARSAATARARATVMVYVHDIDFRWDGVLTARGQLRLLAVGPDGRVLLDRNVETDTLVGSRGDRHDALVRFVLAQAMDISRKDLARVLR